jgi:hypothetical protein
MKFTNKFNLPAPLINALERREYSRGAADKSVTDIIDAPKVKALRRMHNDEIEQDVSEAVWMLFGSAIHYVLESGGDNEHLTEQRLFMKVGDYVLSGAIDVQHVGEADDGTPVVDIIDYKFTSVWSVIISADQDKDKEDWAKQLNVYGALVEACTNYKVRRLRICAILRDWQQSRVDTKKTYPKAAVHMVDIKKWPMAETADFIRTRMKMHMDVHNDHETYADEPDMLPPCSDEERWLRAGDWAVFRYTKAGPLAKVPSKAAQTEKEALDWIEENMKDQQYELKHRPGTPARCDGDYCRVSRWCGQYAQYKKENPELYPEREKGNDE